ncbi:MAG: hypothetical protein ACJ71F_20450, partial [Nitrososphaeraceae archaeon]
MFIIKYRQRLSSIVIGAVILSFFLLAVIIVVSDNAIHIQANAKKEMIVSTPVSLTPSSLNDNNVLNDQNTTTATNNNNNSSSYLTYEDNADGISLM